MCIVPELLHVADLSVEVGDPIETGEPAAGVRRMIPILGGTVAGPRLTGRILPGGADFQLSRNDGVTELEARYVILTIRRQNCSDFCQRRGHGRHERVVGKTIH